MFYLNCPRFLTITSERNEPKSMRSDVVSGSGAYRADPVDVGADLGEDGGLLGEIAAETGTEADDAVDLPGTVGVLAVQRAAGVPLSHVRTASFYILLTF